MGIPCYSMIQQHIMHQKRRILKKGHQFSRIHLLTFLLLRFIQHRLHNLVLHHLRQKMHLYLSQLLKKRQNSQKLHKKCHEERKSHPPRSQHKIAFHMLCGKNKSPQMTPQLQPGPVKVRFIDAWGKPIVQNPPIMQETAEQGTAKITIKIPGLPNKIITVPPKVKEVLPCQKYPTLASRLACPPPIIAPPMLVSLTAEEMETSIASQEIVETTHTSTRVSLFKTARKKLRAKFVQAHQKLWIAKNIHNIILHRKKMCHLHTKNYSLWNIRKEVLFASSPLLHLCPHANLPPEDMSDSELSHTSGFFAIHSRK